MTVTMTLEEYEKLKDLADKCEQQSENCNFWIKMHADTNKSRLHWQNRFVLLESILIDEFGMTHAEIWDRIKEDERIPLNEGGAQNDR